MTELEFPPFTAYKADVVAHRGRVVPLEASQSVLWSDKAEFWQNRDMYLGLMVLEWHQLRTVDGRTHRFNLAGCTNDLGEAMQALDIMAVAMDTHIIGWERGSNLHVLTTEDFSSIPDFQRPSFVRLIDRISASPA